jgi:hypothetical protein
MIPGNRPEDVAWEVAYEWALDQYAGTDFTLNELKRAVLIGIAAVKAEREVVSALLEEARADERMIAKAEGRG